MQNNTCPSASAMFGIDCSCESSQIRLLPVPWEGTVTYGRGTAHAPNDILQASEQIDLCDIDLCNIASNDINTNDALNHSNFVNPSNLGIVMMPPCPVVESANFRATQIREALSNKSGHSCACSSKNYNLVTELNELSVIVNEQVKKQVIENYGTCKLIGVIGGEHSVAFGALQGISESINKFSVLQVDAHSDTRKAYEGRKFSHASVMRNVILEIPNVTKLIQIGVRDFCQEELEFSKTYKNKISCFYDAHIASELFCGSTWSSIVDKMILELSDLVWVSFDIDGLDPSLCPHTGTPVPGGLSFNQAAFILKAIAHSGRKIIGFDLCEVSNGQTLSNVDLNNRTSSADEWDANVGMRILYKLCTWGLASQEK